MPNPKTNDSKESDFLKSLKSNLSQCACAPIEEAIPSWPMDRDGQYFTIARDFTYSHQPSHTGDGLSTEDIRPQAAEDDAASLDRQPFIDDLFCVPRAESQRLYSVLKQAKGGSVLITGYRGTGKTSLTNQVIKKLKAEEDKAFVESRKKPGAKFLRYFIYTMAIGIPALWVFIARHFYGSAFGSAASLSEHLSENCQHLLQGILFSATDRMASFFFVALTLLSLVFLTFKKRILFIVSSRLSAKVVQTKLPLSSEQRKKGPTDNRADLPIQWYIRLHHFFEITLGEAFIFILDVVSFSLIVLYAYFLNRYVNLAAPNWFCLFVECRPDSGYESLTQFSFWVYPLCGAFIFANLLLHFYWIRLIVKRLLVPREGGYVRIGINLSTSRDASSLASIMIRELYEKVMDGRLADVPSEKFERVYKRSRGFVRESIERTNQGVVGHATGNLREAERASAKLNPLAFAGQIIGIDQSSKDAKEYTEGPYSLHDAQSDLVLLLKELRHYKHTVIFVFDELDKLIPRDEGERKSTYDQMLYEIQSIVADLRFLLVESHAFNIFIAGKIVDDSWHEDQNKGDGLFESVFVQNIYLPSVLSLDLDACLGPHRGWLEREWTAWIEAAEDKAKAKAKRAAGKSAASPAPWAYLDLGDKEKKREYFQKLADGLLETFLDQMGIKKYHWTYNTGLLVLPHLSEEEWRQLILHAGQRLNEARKMEKAPTYDTTPIRNADRFRSPREIIKPYLMLIAEHLSNSNAGKSPFRCGQRQACQKRGDSTCDLQSLLTCQYGRCKPNGCTFGEFATSSENDVEEKSIAPASERHCRHLRYLLQNLTFKGRGIPRKILREFYALIRHREALRRKVEPLYWKSRGDPTYIIYIEDSQQQRIKFYSNIVARLEQNQDVFRTIGDKGEVALFHIIDHIFKFHTSSFSWNDIENASFMSDRVELFPSRELTTTLIGMLEDVLIERLDARHRSYVLLPRMRHNLAAIYLRWPAEQIDLRFTDTEFKNELRRLRKQLEGVDEQEPGKRLDSMRTQARIGRIYELIGNQQEAFFAYAKALRWMRTSVFDLDRELRTAPAKNASDFRLSTVINYLSIGVEVAHAMGHLNEKGREFRWALQYYETALSFAEHAWSLIPQHNRQQSLSSRPVRPREAYEYAEVTEKGNRLSLEERLLPQTKNSLHPILLPSEFWLSDMNPAIDMTAPQEIFPFRHSLNKASFEPFNTALEPLGVPRSLNHIAIASEKMWHRYAANKYLVQVVDFFMAVHDEFAAIDQMLFIGEVMVRRRDPRLAARWYTLAFTQAQLLDRSPNEKEDTTTKFGGDRRLKHSPQQSTVRAKLFEYLGDLYFATQGTAFIPSQKLHTFASLSDTERREAREEGIQHFRMLLAKGGIKDVEHRDEEFFYTLAIQQYIVNDQPLRVTDVYCKKLTIRYERLQELHKDASDGEIATSWCPFWLSASNVLNTLAKPQSGLADTYAETYLVHDRNRFGILCFHVGRMMELVEARDLHHFWRDRSFAEDWGAGERKAFNTALADEWKKLGLITEETTRETILSSYSDLEKAQQSFNYVFRVLFDNNSLALQGTDKKESASSFLAFISNPDTLEINSMLWHLCRKAWRTTEIPGLEQLSTEGPNPPSHINWFLFGHLLNLNEQAKMSHDGYPEYNRRLSSLYLAEVALLSSWLSLDDSIHDINAAHVCQELGRLYLRGIELFLDLLPEMQGKDGFNWAAVRALYLLLHSAAKHFLTYAIDLYRIEEPSQRKSYVQLANAWTRLGDLLLIRSIVIAGMDDSKFDTKFSKRALSENHYQTIMEIPLKFYEEDPKDGSLATLIEEQEPQCRDQHIEDCLCQTTQAYKEALRAALEEKDEYLKRYRFPHDSFFSHNTVMDRNRHYDICESIHWRHWNYQDMTSQSALTEDEEMRKNVAKLHDEMKRLGTIGQNVFPAPVLAFELPSWMKSLQTLLEHIDLNNVEGSRFVVCCSDKQYTLKRRAETEAKAEADAANQRRFFRSFNDQLHFDESEPHSA